MSNEVLIKNGDKANWGTDNAPIEPKRLPEGYPYKEGAPDDIIFDGTFIDIIYVEGNPMFGLFSEQCPPISSFIGASVTDSNHDMTYKIIAEGIQPTDESKKMYIITLAEPVSGELLKALSIFVVYQATELQGITFQKTGLYQFAGDRTIERIVFAETTHPIAAEFLPTATPTAAGAMKQAAAVANVTAAPTAEEFNALLKSLRDAGILATS